MALTSKIIAFLSGLLVLGGPAWSLGLGNVAGVPILGHDLRLEIPLLGIDQGLPSSECFKVRPPSIEIESGFVLRNAQIQVVSDHNQAKLVLTSASPVREPIIEFSLAVGCGFGLTKDYLLLTAEPSKLSLPPVTTSPASPQVTEAISLSAPSVKVQKKSANLQEPASSFQISSDITLEKLARQRYPLQPKAREKFMRMMQLANQALEGIDDVIPSGTELRLPPGLPVRREPGAKFEEKMRPVPPSISDKQTLVQGASAPRGKPPRQDVLVLGQPGQKNAAELLAEAERLTALLVEQTNSQAATADKLSMLEDKFKSLQKHATVLESRIHTIEAERQAEKLASKPASFDFIELLIAVLAGGALGGLSLYSYNRIQSRRERLNKTEREVSSQTARFQPGLPKASVSASDKQILPWQVGQRATQQNGVKENVEIQAPVQAIPEQAIQVAEPTASPQNDFDFVSKP